jgi:DNA polymerase-3 subunit delta'
MFDRIAGNQQAKDLLKRTLESQRVPGALLFSGEEGIGKKLFALEIAKALNCRSPRGVEACDVCPPCVRISKVNYPQSDDSDDWKDIIWTDHPDVGMVVAPKRVLLVNQMRQIEREANYRPFEGKARVFLIEDADKFNDQSANALLKVLEEPPRTSHLILITSRPAMLLATIRSRCQMIRFSPLTVSEIEQYLLQTKVASPAEARLRARLAHGSIGRALASDIESFKPQRDAMLKVIEALASDDRALLLLSSEELNSAGQKDDYESSLDILETLIRDALMLSLGVQDDQIVNDDLRVKLAKVAKSVNARTAANWIAKIEELREQLVVNVNRKVATDALFLSMASG